MILGHQGLCKTLGEALDEKALLETLPPPKRKLKVEGLGFGVQGLGLMDRV